MLHNAPGDAGADENEPMPTPWRMCWQRSSMMAVACCDDSSL